MTHSRKKYLASNLQILCWNIVTWTEIAVTNVVIE